MKKLSNTEAEFKKTLPIKKACILLLENLMIDKRLSEKYWSLEGSLLSLYNREHSLSKNELNSSALFFKSVTSSLSRNKGGVMGT